MGFAPIFLLALIIFNLLEFWYVFFMDFFVGLCHTLSHMKWLAMHFSRLKRDFIHINDNLIAGATATAPASKQRGKTKRNWKISTFSFGTN